MGAPPVYMAQPAQVMAQVPVVSGVATGIPVPAADFGVGMPVAAAEAGSSSSAGLYPAPLGAAGSSQGAPPSKGKDQHWA